MKNKRLRLSIWGYILHYLIASMYFLVGIFTLVEITSFIFESNENWQESEVFWMGIGFIILGLWIFYRQWQRLHFDIIMIENLSKEEVFRIAKDILKNYNWQIVKESDSSLVAEGGSFCNSFMDNLENSKRLTIEYEKEQVLINCIVAPPDSGSLFTFGKLRMNLNDFTNLFCDYVYFKELDKQTPSYN